MNNPVWESLHYWIKGGVLLVPIAGVGFLIFYYYLRLNSRLRAALDLPPDLEDRLDSYIREDPGSARRVVGLPLNNPVLSGVIEFVDGGLRRGEKLSRLFDEIRRGLFPPLRRDLTVIEALIAAAPLLGLLGTVWGMITTFQALAGKTGITSRAMAGGISQALITTQFGLVVALPGIFGVARLRRRIQELEVRVTSLWMHFALKARRVGL